MAEEDTRERILNVAGAAFAEQGFQATTIRSICREADVNVAAVNYHFGDKERLYAEALKHAHHFRIEQVPMPEWSHDTPAEDRLRDFIRTMLKRMLGVHELPWQEALMMREMFQPTGACRELVEDIFHPHFQMLLGILDHLVPAETPTHERHQLAFSIIGQCVFYRFHNRILDMLVPVAELDRHYTPLELAEHVANFTIAGLRSFDRLRDSSSESRVSESARNVS